MSDTRDDGGPAFPHDEPQKVGVDTLGYAQLEEPGKHHPGMSYRRYVAAQVMAQTWLTVADHRFYSEDAMREAARYCWKAADAPLATEKEGGR